MVRSIPYLLVAIMLLLCGCSELGNITREQNLEGWFGLPDKIVIYYEGEERAINQDNESYTQIIDLLNTKIQTAQNPSTVDYAYDCSEVEKIKLNGLALDLFYSRVMIAKVKCGTNYIERKYSRLFIPLTGRDSKLLFFGNPALAGNALGSFNENQPIIDYVSQSF